VWPRAARERVAQAAAADAAARARLAAARRQATDRIRASVASPAGLATAFAAGFAVAPALRGVGRLLRTSGDLRLTLATFGITPRDVVAGLAAAWRFAATAAGPPAPGRDPATPPPA
jgi:hypothetical protein